MKSFRVIIFMALLCSFALPALGQTSLLASGDWYKFSVERNGIYRISFDLLRKSGVDPGKIDPRNIRIYGREGGMLPQANSITRPSELVECAIAVRGEEDGRFDRNDYILFYAEGPDDFEYDLQRDIYRYENNLYSDHNYYFLTIASSPGKRIGHSENIEGNYHPITSFNAFSYYEKDAVNVLRSGREWFGEKFGIETSHSLTYNLQGITQGSNIKIVSDVMGQSYTDASFRLLLNNVQVIEQKLTPIPGGRYDVKGIHRRDTAEIAASEVQAPTRSSQQVRYEFTKGTGYSQGFLDFIMLDFKRDLALYDNQTFFLSAESTDHEVSTFRVRSVSTDAEIWDITDHYNVQRQEFALSGSEAIFSALTGSLRKWMVFNNRTPEPVFVSKVANQNLLGMSTPELLIITHPRFLPAAQRLAAHRSAFNNLTTAVVTTEEIYNQFSGGRQDVSALRDFARYLRQNNQSALRFILLFGKGSYDYKDLLPNNTNFVPTYESRNSLDPMLSYSSDDYFAFLEDSEGNWSETPVQNHTLDAGVGRLPVTTIEEAQVVVDKIIRYDMDKRALGAWRKKVVFVADDGNGEDGYTSLHQWQADQLALSIENNQPAIDARRIFLGSYNKVQQPNGEVAPEMENDIKRAFDIGALIINFTGHGSERVWTDERVLTDQTITALRNDRYPFLVTATCEFGRQDDPYITSTAERSLTHKDGGSIGLVTTARPVNAATNFGLNRVFYEELFKRGDGGYPPIGEVFRNTKNNSVSGVSNRNFSLIGDPSMNIALPDSEVEIVSLKTSTGSDTLKALSTVIARGRVLDSEGLPDADFNGIVEATLYDRQRDFVTIGKNDPPFQYRQWDNAVFRGRASVNAGEFEFSFILPADISPDVAEGRLGLYAFDATKGKDAKGVYRDTRIGGMEPDPPSDVTPPTIRLFIGDTTFVNGGITSPDTYLVALFEDESGINISSLGSNGSITARLDDSEQVYVLNEYYVSNVDTWKKGSLRFPMLGLTPGPHRVTLYAQDVFNNPAEATISFIVTDGQAIVIEDFGNYPNPFKESTTLFFTHNRSGDDLEAQLFIFNPAGQLVASAEVSVQESEYHINLLELNTWGESGKKLPPGPYFARVVVRSMTNGSKNEKVTKLIVLN